MKVLLALIALIASATATPIPFETCADAPHLKVISADGELSCPLQLDVLAWGFTVPSLDFFEFIVPSFDLFEVSSHP